MEKNIFLIGFMGAGKSTVAAYLSREYGLERLEMDQEIERQEQCSVSDIFREHGEEYFRQLETGLLESLEKKGGMVVSCGGGAPLRECNVEAMRKSGTIVFLTASPETILDRVKNSHSRPLLENHKDVDYIAGLLAQRQGRYEAAAGMSVATDGRSAAEIGDEIMRTLGK